VDLKGLAKHLNLSITTVSRALNGYSDVSPRTRERVEEAAARLGYSPNPLGQRLRRGKTEAIGIVLPAPAEHFGDPFFLELIAGLGTGLRSSGYDLVVTCCPEGPEEANYYRRFVAGRRVDGLIVTNTRRRDERILYLLDQDFPFVAFGRSDEVRRPFPYLDFDGEAGFRVATDYLIELGHRRIGLVTAPAEYNYGNHRLAGYKAALAAAGLDYDADLVIHGPPSETGGRRGAERFLKLAAPPTAILCATDLMAIGAMYALQDYGLRPGRDVSVVGYDDIPLARLTDPTLTTSRQPTREAGRQLFDLLMRRIDGTPVEELQQVLMSELVVRASTAAPAAPAAVAAA